LAQAVKWAVTVVLAMTVFLMALWIVLLICGFLARSWSHSDQIATAVAVATLIGTATLTIGGWWAQRDPQPQLPVSVQPRQTSITNVSNSTGIIGNNVIDSDIHYD
jgi:cellobiose-specific phosphotransferase system component IIC